MSGLVRGRMNGDRLHARALQKHSTKQKQSSGAAVVVKHRSITGPRQNEWSVVAAAPGSLTVA